MKIMKIQKTLGAGVMSLGLVVGMAGFAGAAPGSIDTTGPRSNNEIRTRTTHRVRVNNENNLKVSNDNYQDAWSGDAAVRGNTTGGSAETGAATNANSFNANVEVDNSASAAAAVQPVESAVAGSISDTGPRSNNEVVSTSETNVSVENTNNLNVENNNTQTATSGNATVKGNTTGGDATTGDASNTNSTSVTFKVSN